MNDVTNGSGRPPQNRFRLDKAEGKLAGVCAGLGNYFGMDPMIVRLIFAAGTLIGFGSFLVIYILIALLAD
jgi:phage shock protein PspC (stress-responsive transcriptional regulator)